MRNNESLHCFRIADWQVRVCFTDTNELAGIHLLPSFAPFACDMEDEEPLLTMYIDPTWTFPEATEHIKRCDTGNGDIVVDRTSQGEYLFLIRNLRGEDCARMHASSDFSTCHCQMLGEREDQRSFGLNNAMMMAYAFAGAMHGTLLVHASVVRHDGKGYAFVAKSGTGKSTQTQNWLKVIPNCDLMNDDNPVVRVTNGEAWIYGSPWSGKTPCYRQVKAPLGAVTQIVRDADNFVQLMHPLMAFNALLSSCSVMKWDTPTYRGICDTVKQIVELVGVHALHCTKEPESAIVCYHNL